jgi:DeoR/GlpR family transcriptional regulator of sugar metabolism
LWQIDVTLNGTEKAVYAILKQKPDFSREEIADRISKTVRTVQRALNSPGDKIYFRRVGSKTSTKDDNLITNYSDKIPQITPVKYLGLLRIFLTEAVLSY